MQHLKPNLQVSRKLCEGPGFNIIVVGNGQEKLNVEEKLRAQAKKHRFIF